jgi:hypothetical protein
LIILKGIVNYQERMSYFGKAKPKVGEREDRTPYTTYWIHSIDRVEAEAKRIKRDFTKYISIDPATKTYAIRIESRNSDRTMTPYYFNLWNLDNRVQKDANDPVIVYTNLTNELDEIKDYFMDVDVIIIERQPPINYKSTRIMQHTISYFSIVLRDSPHYPVIYDVSPKLKGKMLGAPLHISQPELKKWAIVEALEILLLAGDKWSYAVLSNPKLKKGDDYADTICQIEALLLYLEDEITYRNRCDGYDKIVSIKRTW